MHIKHPVLVVVRPHENSACASVRDRCELIMQNECRRMEHPEEAQQPFGVDALKRGETGRRQQGGGTKNGRGG